jgi:ABC-type nitrate/sulfonate/bicarbonate transport system substrate-binding protein
MKMMRATIIVMTTTAALVVFLALTVHAAEKVRVATGGFSPSVPPYFSYAKSVLLKQDIEVEDVLMSSGSLSAQALAAGQVKVVLTTGAVVPQFNLSGGDMVIIAGTINRLPYQIVARGEIKTATLLKGKRVAISRFGSSSEWLVRYGLVKMGLDPDKDVVIIQTGAQSARLAALQSNAAQATLLAPPISTTAVQKLGFVQLADLTDLDITYPLQSVITTRAYLRDSRPLLKRLLRGLALAIRQYREQPQVGIDFQIKQFKVSAEEAEIGYRASIRVTEPDLRLPDASALDLTLKEIAARVEKAKKITVAELNLVDDSLRAELVKEGLFSAAGKAGH